MPNTTKSNSERDYQQAIRFSFNDVDSTLSMAPEWVTAAVGRKITYTISTTSVSNDTVTRAYMEGSTVLYQVRYIYAETARTTLVSIERIA
jgi:hypothetical protein